MIQHIRSFWFVLGSSRGEVLRMVSLFVFVSIMDVVGVSLIGPYVAAVLEPARLEQYPQILAALKSLGRHLNIEPLTALGFVLIVLFVVKGVVAYLIHHKIFAFAFDFRARLIERLMNAYLHMPFAFYLSRGSASLVQSVTNHTKILTDDLLIPSLRFISDALVLCLISTFLLWVNVTAMVVLAGVFCVTFIAYLKLVQPRVRQAGELVSIAHEGVITGVTQGVQGIKEIKVLGAEKSFLADIRKSALQNTLSQTTFNSTLVMPRYLMETVIVVFILSLTLVAINSGAKPAELFSLLAMFAAAGLRALPAMTQVSASLASMNYSAFALRAVDRDLRDVGHIRSTEDRSTRQTSTTGTAAPATPFKKISVVDISFRYPGLERAAVDCVSLVIERGSAVGLIGESGSGKTTLVDLIVGLHSPSGGHVLIDGVDVRDHGIDAWMRRIAYIPQMPFIAEDTLARNVALGVNADAIDAERLNKCIQLARLTGVVDNLPNGVNTVLGGHGSRLSGGERQRVALARALYQDRDVLVFDEATSALDIDTEREIVKTIEGLRGKKTMIVIAHRLSTLQGCDIVHRLNEGKLTGSGALSDLLRTGEAGYTGTEQ